MVWRVIYDGHAFGFECVCFLSLQQAKAKEWMASARIVSVCVCVCATMLALHIADIQTLALSMRVSIVPTKLHPQLKAREIPRKRRKKEGGRQEWRGIL